MITRCACFPVSVTAVEGSADRNCRIPQAHTSLHTYTATYHRTSVLIARCSLAHYPLRISHASHPRHRGSRPRRCCRSCCAVSRAGCARREYQPLEWQLPLLCHGRRRHVCRQHEHHWVGVGRQLLPRSRLRGGGRRTPALRLHHRWRRRRHEHRRLPRRRLRHQGADARDAHPALAPTAHRRRLVSFTTSR